MRKFFISSLLTVFVTTAAGVANAAPTLYVPLGTGNQVVAIDAATNKVTASFSGVENPHGLVITPDNEYLIAGSFKEEPLKPDQPKDTPNSQLYLIHPVHGHVMSTIAVPGWTHHQAITPDGKYVISTHGARGYVSFVDLKMNKLSKTVDTGMSPNSTIISRDGKRAYVSNMGSNNLSEIDVSTMKVTRTLDSGPGPGHLTFSADESIIYVANAAAGKVSAVSVKSGKVEKEYEIGKSIHGVDIGDDGNTLFISDTVENKMVALNTGTGDKKELSLSPAPYHLNTVKGTGKVYVSSSSKPLMWVVDQKDLKVVGTIDLPAGGGHQMAVGK